MPEHSIHYLEIVTPDVDSVCSNYEKIIGGQFSARVLELGNARLSEIPGGLIIGIRAPMHDTEKPVIRPYMLVRDLDSSVKQAAEMGANIMLDRMEIQGHGIIAIYEIGGIQQGLWQMV